MKPEEYLRARGWTVTSAANAYRDDGDSEFAEVFTVDAAVALQLAEDRAAFNFVRERSGMRHGLLVEPDPRDITNLRIAMLPQDKRGEAMRRASRSYSVPDTCVRRDGCRIDGGDVVWPDGERWPKRPT